MTLHLCNIMCFSLFEELKMKKYLIAACLLSLSSFSFGEDIELYISENIKQAKERPQVLIVFDNSVSMSTMELVKEPYDPNINYKDPDLWGGLLAELLDLVGGIVGGLLGGLLGNDTELLDFIDDDDKIYYTRGGEDVPDIRQGDDEKRKFDKDINNCKVAQDIIDEYGFYTGYVREYKFEGNIGAWRELHQTDGSYTSLIDCEADVLENNNHNEKHYTLDLLSAGVLLTMKYDSPEGFPIDGAGSAFFPELYTDNAEDSNVDWSGKMVTLYSDNYLYWYNNDYLEKEDKSRMELAQKSISDIINSSPHIDFGLQVFNHNNIGENIRDGGRIVAGIKELTSENQTNLLNIINNQLDPENNTPLCETLYEASRYFGGQTVDFGDDDSDLVSAFYPYTAHTPPRDTSIEADGNKYISPFSACSNKAYVILITDGEPTQDLAANEKIKALGLADDYPMTDVEGNYLAALAGWMNNNDVNKELDGVQTVSTYTIGFSDDTEAAVPLLQKTAELGGGQYYTAKDSGSLTSALTSALTDLEPGNNSLTSASVAANNFDRTETLNSVYYAMFKPDRGPRWEGNLKKYKVDGDKQVGKNGKSAINSSTGNFSTDVTSFWSDTQDGSQVSEGGVAEMLRNKTDRLIYSDIGQADSLAELNVSNALIHFETEQAYADFLGVNVSNAGEYFNWNLGIDVDDEDEDGDNTDMRSDVFGDPLHSQPLAINYGDKVHLLIGTNAGALHMFQDTGDTINETWAFMPKELFPNISTLRHNESSDNKVYGVDGKISSYIDDKNGNGIIETGDKVWIFFGLRRGGSSYYALDISNPDNPSLMWQIEAGTTGFKELGQTWSSPKVGYSKLNFTEGVPKPVLFFGGGYGTLKDNDGVGEADSVGRAIYMVDAETGNLKWSMAKEDATTEFNGEDSIPSSIAILDSDSDGLVDRLYAGDTGGNVWRVDMPSADPDDISVFKLASFGGDTNLTDRRFFNEPSIVRTFITETIESEVSGDDGTTSTVTVNQEVPYDAVLLGSADISNPLGTDTEDSFFMIKDKNIISQTFGGLGNQSIPDIITVNDLYDFTDDPFGKVSDTGKQALSLAVSNKSGWFFDLVQAGEKSTSSAIVINNTAYFTSFTAPDLSQEQAACTIPSGQGWLYAVDLALGINKFEWATEDSNSREDRITFVNEQFLGAPSLIILPEDPEDATSAKSGNLIVGRRMIDVGFNLQTMRTYLYVTEE